MSKKIRIGKVREGEIISKLGLIHIFIKLSKQKIRIQNNGM